MINRHGSNNMAEEGIAANKGRDLLAQWQRHLQTLPIRKSVSCEGVTLNPIRKPRYLVVWLGYNTTNIGKPALNIKVNKRDNHRLSHIEISTRNILKILNAFSSSLKFSQGVL